MHVNVSPRTESRWTRKNTDCCEQVRANTDDRADPGTTIEAQEDYDLGDFTCWFCKEDRTKIHKYAQRTLSAISNSTYVVAQQNTHRRVQPQLCRSVMTLVTGYPELNVEHNSYIGAMDCRGARAAVRVIIRHVNFNLVTCWISPSVCVACPLAAFGGSISSCRYIILRSWFTGYYTRGLVYGRPFGLRPRALLRKLSHSCISGKPPAPTL